MKTILFIILATVCMTAYAGDPWYDLRSSERLEAVRQWQRREIRTIVRATSPYTNPYFQPNPNYEPLKIGEPTWVQNEFNGGLAKPPRPILDILVKGTYTIKEEKHVNPVK